MADLIDRQAAKEAVKKRLGTLDLFESRFNADIDAIPAVDAVEVVRCKDCEREQECRIAQRLGIMGYCSEGERKDK